MIEEKNDSVNDFSEDDIQRLKDVFFDWGYEEERFFSDERGIWAIRRIDKFPNKNRTSLLIELIRKYGEKKVCKTILTIPEIYSGYLLMGIPAISLYSAEYVFHTSPECKKMLGTLYLLLPQEIFFEKVFYNGLSLKSLFNVFPACKVKYKVKIYQKLISDPDFFWRMILVERNTNNDYRDWLGDLIEIFPEYSADFEFCYKLLVDAIVKRDCNALMAIQAEIVQLCCPERLLQLVSQFIDKSIVAVARDYHQVVPDESEFYTKLCELREFVESRKVPSLQQICSNWVKQYSLFAVKSECTLEIREANDLGELSDQLKNDIQAGRKVMLIHSLDTGWFIRGKNYAGECICEDVDPLSDLAKFLKEEEIDANCCIEKRKLLREKAIEYLSGLDSINGLDISNGSEDDKNITPIIQPVLRG